jgi:site-specific recombinase XerD
MRNYGLWLDCLQQEGLLDPECKPGDRASPQHLTRYLKALRARGVSVRTLVNHAVSLRHMFEALAPERDWTWMLPMIRKLKTAVVVAKNHSDLPSIRELFELGLHLMYKAEKGLNGSPKQRAIMFRNGLMIAILAARPIMRRENLARMKIDENLVLEGDRYVLRFTDAEMKGGRERAAPLPRALTGAMERYVTIHRPILLLGRPERDRTLFISMMGRPIYPHAMSNEIGEITQAAFGRRVCAHEFRHAAGSSIAKESPERVDTVAAVLGHADYRTSEIYYIFADENAAYVRLDKVLTNLMRDDLLDAIKE